MDVSKNKGTPKSSILIGFSFINHPFWGTPILGNTKYDEKITLRTDLGDSCFSPSPFQESHHFLTTRNRGDGIQGKGTLSNTALRNDLRALSMCEKKNCWFKVCNGLY